MKLFLSYLLLVVDFTHGMNSCKDTLDCPGTQICGFYTQRWHQSQTLIYEKICIDKGDCGVNDNLEEYSIKMDCSPLSFSEMMLIKLVAEFVLVCVVCFFVKRNSKKENVEEKQFNTVADHSGIV